jgi:hypothetical protein
VTSTGRLSEIGVDGIAEGGTSSSTSHLVLVGKPVRMIIEIVVLLEVGALPGTDEASPGPATGVSARERLLERQGESMTDRERPRIAQPVIGYRPDRSAKVGRHSDDRRGEIDHILPAGVAIAPRNLAHQNVDRMRSHYVLEGKALGQRIRPRQGSYPRAWKTIIALTDAAPCRHDAAAISSRCPGLLTAQPAPTSAYRLATGSPRADDAAGSLPPILDERRRVDTSAAAAVRREVVSARRLLGAAAQTLRQEAQPAAVGVSLRVKTRLARAVGAEGPHSMWALLGSNPRSRISGHRITLAGREDWSAWSSNEAAIG